MVMRSSSSCVRKTSTAPLHVWIPNIGIELSETEYQWNWDMQSVSTNSDPEGKQSNLPGFYSRGQQVSFRSPSELREEWYHGEPSLGWWGQRDPPPTPDPWGPLVCHFQKCTCEGTFGIFQHVDGTVQRLPRWGGVQTRKDPRPGWVP